MASVILLGFWITLALLFGGMSFLSNRMRKRVPAILKSAMQGQWVSGYDFTKLNALFQHLFWFELVAFLVTSAAAFAEFLVLSGGIS